MTKNSIDMKNKYLSFVAMAAAAFATSCSSDHLATEPGQQTGGTETVTLEASIGNGNSTRVGMGRKDGKVQLYWHAGDQVSVQTKSKTDETSFSNTAFDIAETIATGATKATFKGTVATGYDVGSYALYPYSDKHTFTSTTITYNLPASYEYTTVEGNIFSKTTNGTTTYPTNSTRMPMLGTIAEGKITFQYIAGLIVIRIDKMPAASGTLTVTADQKLSGDFTISDLSASNLEITTTSDETAADDKEVTFKYSGATQGGVGVFYLPLATGDYTNLKISLGDAANTMTAEYGSLKVDRADVITIPVYQSEGGNSYSCDYVVNGHKFIDLCLPSGTLWAETNVGAETAADYGKYYAWGEVTAYGEAKDFDDGAVKTCYDWNNYKYGTGDNSMTKYYLGNSPTLESSDDAAYMNWGSFCRMPSKAELSELFDDSNTTRAWATKLDSKKNEIGGALIISKKNGKAIFLPAAGNHYSSGYQNGWSNTYIIGSYPSNSLHGFGNSSDYASIFTFTYWIRTGKYEEKKNGTANRCYGYPVRPVAKKSGYELDNGGSVDDMDMNEFDDSWK